VRSWSFLGVLAVLLLVACQPVVVQQTPTVPFPSPSAACLDAPAPAGTTLIARVCDSKTSEDLFVAAGAYRTQNNAGIEQVANAIAVSSATHANSLYVPLPFDPGSATFFLIKYPGSTFGTKWDEYGVRVFDGDILARAVVDCPVRNNPQTDRLRSRLSCPVPHGLFNEVVGSPPQFQGLPNSGLTFPATSAIYTLDSKSPGVGPFKQSLTFWFAAASGTSSTALSTGPAGKVVHL
jgi:hypothetical protein